MKQTHCFRIIVISLLLIISANIHTNQALQSEKPGQDIIPNADPAYVLNIWRYQWDLDSDGTDDTIEIDFLISYYDVVSETLSITLVLNWYDGANFVYVNTYSESETVSGTGFFDPYFIIQPVLSGDFEVIVTVSPAFILFPPDSPPYYFYGLGTNSPGFSITHELNEFDDNLDGLNDAFDLDLAVDYSFLDGVLQFDIEIRLTSGEISTTVETGTESIDAIGSDIYYFSYYYSSLLPGDYWITTIVSYEGSVVDERDIYWTAFFAASSNLSWDESYELTDLDHDGVDDTINETIVVNFENYYGTLEITFTVYNNTNWIMNTQVQYVDMVDTGSEIVYFDFSFLSAGSYRVSISYKEYDTELEVTSHSVNILDGFLPWNVELDVEFSGEDNNRNGMDDFIDLYISADGNNFDLTVYFSIYLVIEGTNMLKGEFIDTLAIIGSGRVEKMYNYTSYEEGNYLFVVEVKNKGGEKVLLEELGKRLDSVNAPVPTSSSNQISSTNPITESTSQSTTNSSPNNSSDTASSTPSVPVPFMDALLVLSSLFTVVFLYSKRKITESY